MWMSIERDKLQVGGNIREELGAEGRELGVVG